MLNLSTPWMRLIIEAENKQYMVRGIFKTMEEANVFCIPDPNVPDVGVICEDDTLGLIFVADLEPINN